MQNYGLLPTSSLAPALVADTSAGRDGLRGLILRFCLLSSPTEESAILRRLSAGEELEEVLRLRLAAAGA